MEGIMIRDLIKALRHATAGETIAAFALVFGGAFIIALAGG